MSSRSAVLNALRSISERISFAVFLRIATAIDPLYEVPSSDSAVGVPIIVECQAAFAALRNSAGYSKALAMRTRALLAVSLQEMTIPA